ncbi:alpha/beta hydrolase family protein [Kordiimonas aquimaris]|uniref:alpha/beta hydrolase family protein n=1 Tax=Kordiimonas aquimaris TaxID=707591 RepID=UPI0021D3B7E6|nr:alpha/beta hydrolase [Kordiimonas aquimaris]
MKFFLYVTAWFVMALASPVEAQNHISPDEINIQNKTTKIKTYKSDQLTERPVLVVALHGDAPFNNPSYQYAFARQIVAQAKNTISIGMLRPGYTDSLGRTSDGVRGEAIGDSYDKPRIDQIATAIEQLNIYYNAGKVIVAGHSGGSAITAKLIAAYPTLIDHAVIVSCPCNINAWRADMYKTSKYEGFNGQLNVVSPIDVVDSVSADTSISIYVGDNDNVTQEYLSLQYYNHLSTLGKKADLHVLKGEHDIFLHEEIINSIISKVKEFNKALP